MSAKLSYKTVKYILESSLHSTKQCFILFVCEDCFQRAKTKFTNSLEITSTSFLYPFTPCVPFVPLSNRKILSFINTDTSQMSLFNHSKTVRTRDLKFWENYHHTLFVMCPVSHVRWHMLLVTCHISDFFYTGGQLVFWGSVISVVYSV